MVKQLILNENEEFTGKIINITAQENPIVLLEESKTKQLYRWELKAKCLQGITQYLYIPLSCSWTSPKRTINICRYKDIKKQSKGRTYYESNVKVYQRVSEKEGDWYPIEYNLKNIMLDKNTSRVIIPYSLGGGSVLSGRTIETAMKLDTFLIKNGYPQKLRTTQQGVRKDSDVIEKYIRDNKITIEGYLQAVEESKKSMKEKQKNVAKNRWGGLTKENQSQLNKFLLEEVSDANAFVEKFIQSWEETKK